MANQLLKAREDTGFDIWLNPEYLAAAQEMPGTRVRLFTLDGPGNTVVRATVANFLSAVGPFWDYFLVTLDGGETLAVSRDWISRMDFKDGKTRLFAEYYGWVEVQGTPEGLAAEFNGV